METILKQSLLPNPSKDAILRALENSITPLHASDFNLDERSLRSFISELRKEGFLICSGNEGYWLGTDEEIIRTGYRLIAHGKAEIERGKALIVACSKALERRQLKDKGVEQLNLELR